MISRHTHGQVTWVDIESPTLAEARQVMDEFSLDASIAEELLTPSLRPRVETDEGHLFVVLHFPVAHHSPENKRAVTQEVDFIVGQNFVITTRYDTIDQMHAFSRIFEVEAVLDRYALGNSGISLFTAMLAHFYACLGDELNNLDARLKAAEENIFRGRERAMVIELSRIGRHLINFTEALALHRSILSTLADTTLVLFGEKAKRAVRHSTIDYTRAEKLLAMIGSSFRELRETNNTLLITKQNEVMKVLTIMAFVTFPLSLIATIFGMNTEFTPIVGHPYDFWIIVSSMALCTTIFFSYFKYKEWL